MPTLYGPIRVFSFHKVKKETLLWHSLRHSQLGSIWTLELRPAGFYLENFVGGGRGGTYTCSISHLSSIIFSSLSLTHPKNYIASLRLHISPPPPPPPPPPPDETLTCFVSGLTAIQKTYLQFIFPFYMWTCCTNHHSCQIFIQINNILGNRGVPLLASLFLLSYMKLLRFAVSSLEFLISIS